MIASYTQSFAVAVIIVRYLPKISLNHAIYFYIKVVLYHVLLLNLSIVWPKVVRPNLSSTHKHLQCRRWPVWDSLQAKIILSPNSSHRDLGTKIIGTHNARYVLVSHHRSSVHGQHILPCMVLSLWGLILKEIMLCVEEKSAQLHMCD